MIGQFGPNFEGTDHETGDDSFLNRAEDGYLKYQQKVVFEVKVAVTSPFISRRQRIKSLRSV